MRKRSILTLVLIAVVLVAGFFGMRQLKTVDESSDVYTGDTGSPNAPSSKAEAYYNGKWYRLKDSVDTLLLVGVDSYLEKTDDQSYKNTQQADFLVLLVLDETANTCTALPLDRDTMTTIQALGVEGEKIGTFTGQLALAHTYGTGRVDSLQNTKTAVEQLLFDMQIDHGMCFTMDAVSRVADDVEGVPVTVQDDFSAVTDQLPMGKTVNLKGDLALEYVRARGNMTEATNIARMERQKSFLMSLYERMGEQQENPGFLMDVLSDISPYMISDCSLQGINALYEKILAAELVILDPPAGESVQGDEYMEFHADDAALQDTVISLCYEEAE